MVWSQSECFISSFSFFWGRQTQGVTFVCYLCFSKFLQLNVFPEWHSFSNAKLYLACTAAYLGPVPSAICPDRCTASQIPLLLCILLSSCPKLGGSKVEASVKLSQTNEDAHWSVVCVCVRCCQMGLHCYTALGVKTAELSLKLQSRQ